MKFRIRYAVGRVELAPIDAALVVLSMVLALWMRHDHWSFTDAIAGVLGERPVSTAGIAVMNAMLFTAFRLYRYDLRYSGLETSRSVVLATLCGMPFVVGIQRLIDGFPFPRSVLGIFLVLSIVLVGGLRVALRLVADRLANRSSGAEDSAKPAKRTLIVGNSDQGAHLARAIREDSSLQHYSILGLLDDDSSKTGVYYGSVPVLGPTDMLYDFLERSGVDEVMFVLSDAASGEDIKPLALECRKRQIPVKVISDMADQLTKPAHLRLEDIQVEDFLRRPLHTLDLGPFGGYVTGKRVMVTGAGGSIGSEICRQVVKLGPSELILLGHGENSIFTILQELKRRYPEFYGNIHPVIASVTDLGTISYAFTRYQPNIVFHAAAHKHLALMEQNICEAVQNNVLGTANVARACAEFCVERMVLISTDKAADPICVMGATKALCEVVVRSTAASYPFTKYLCVRFGNVLGSRGSVIPVFNEQIRNGGPVTVTHPDMTRYFMTIPEAVRLVIQAGSVGASGEVYLLDMGKPVRILDLARDMIRLYGYEPEVDIQIQFSGIRPGEKIHETLTNTDEQIEHTEWEGLSRVHGRPIYENAEMNAMLARLAEMVKNHDSDSILSVFQETLPHFAENRETCEV